MLTTVYLPNRPEQTTEVILKGTWTITEDKRAYYDANDVTTTEIHGTLGQVNFDGKSTLTSTYNGFVTLGSYSFSSDSQRKYLTLSNSQGSSQKFTIVSISNMNMSLYQKVPRPLITQPDGSKVSNGGYIETSSLVKN